MKQICDKEYCTACSACYNICPKHAISMIEENQVGYVYPRIDSSKCVDCKLCERICPVNNPLVKKKPLQAFAAICKDSESLDKSASGGAASTIARAVIESGGIVYGCRMNSYTDIVHERFATIHDMYAMRGSKYVQSKIGEVYRQVREDLHAGWVVLFTGTACQVGGLRNYLRKEYDNLYCMDLVCHGVPSQKLLRDDIEYMFYKRNLKTNGTERVTFRKILSDQTSNLDLRFGTFVEGAIPIADQMFLKNNYITAFMMGLTFRENCYHCPYACKERVSDITVADFWGYKGAKIPSGKGISLILSSTVKGQELVKMIQTKMNIEERPIKEAIAGNGQLQHPSTRPIERELFLTEYEKHGVYVYTSLLKKYRRKYKWGSYKNYVIRRLRENHYSYIVLKFMYTKLRKLIINQSKCY